MSMKWCYDEEGDGDGDDDDKEEMLWCHWIWRCVGS